MNLGHLRDALPTLRFEAQQRLGLPGQAGLLLLGAALTMAAAIPRMQDDTRAVRAATRQTVLANARHPGTDGHASNALPGLDTLPDLFPHFGQSADDLAAILAHARDINLALGSAEYQTTAEPNSRFTRYQVTLPVKDQYGTIRRFLAEVLNSVPNAALQEIHVERPAVDGNVVEARVRFDLIYGTGAQAHGAMASAPGMATATGMTTAATSGPGTASATTSSPRTAPAMTSAQAQAAMQHVAFTRAQSAPQAPAVSDPAPASQAREKLASLRAPLSVESSGNPFAVSSWLPPVPPAAPAPAPVVQAAPPTAPPMPFGFVGELDVQAAKPRLFLSSGERLLIVSPGDVIDGQYRVDSVAATQVVLTYLPLNQKQIISTQSEGK